MSWFSIYWIQIQQLTKQHLWNWVVVTDDIFVTFKSAMVLKTLLDSICGIPRLLKSMKLHFNLQI